MQKVKQNKRNLARDKFTSCLSAAITHLPRELKAFHEIEIVFKASYEVACDWDKVCNQIRLGTCLVMLNITD